MHGLREKDKKILNSILKKENFNSSQIEAFLNGKYETFGNAFTAYKQIIDYYRAGYTTEEIKLYNPVLLAEFEKCIKSKNLDLDEIIEMNRWSTDHEEILLTKRESSYIAEHTHKTELITYLKKCGVSQNDIIKIVDFAKSLLKENTDNMFAAVNEFLRENNLPITFSLPIKQFINRQKTLGDTVKSLEKSLKNQLAYNSVFYRVVDKKFMQKYLKDIGGKINLIGSKIEDTGFTSTSYKLDCTYREFAEDDIVIKIFAPKGSQGIDISAFSKFPTEFEFLFNSNDLYIFDFGANSEAKGNNKKTVLYAMLLSKDRECYKEVIYKKSKQKEEDCENEDF